MIWIILIILSLVAFVLYRGVRRILISVKAAKLRRNGVIGKRKWSATFDKVPSAPMRMAFTEVITKSPYLSNFKITFGRFIDTALIADESLNAEIVSVISRQLLSDLSSGDLSSVDWSVKNVQIENETHMVHSAALYAVICTQDKGANIKRRLMEGKNVQAGNDMYLQQKTDREYFEIMNEHYPNLCQLVSVLEPSKSVLIETVAGYLLSE
jgi:hypothetical protein